MCFYFIFSVALLVSKTESVIGILWKQDVT